MTDRVHSLTVVLDHDYRVDDVQAIKDAIGMVRGVLAVENHVSDTTSLMAELRAKHELQMKLMQTLKF